MHVRSLGFGQTPALDDLKARFVRLAGQVRTTANARERLSLLTSLLNVIGQLAKDAPTPEIAARWLEKYRAMVGQLGALRAQVTERPPSAFMLMLDRFSDAMISFGTETVKIAGTAARGIAGVLPVALLGLLAVAGLVAYGYTKHGGVRIRRS